MKLPGSAHTKSALLAIGVAFTFHSNASASLTLDLSAPITGGVPASSTRPWLEATFATTGNNQVTLTLSAPHLTGNEDVDLWLFNVDPSFSQNQLNSLQILSKSVLAGNVNLNGISIDKTTVDGVVRAGFRFDFDFGLPNGPQANRFTGGDVVQIVLGMSLPPNTFTANSFDFLDATGTFKSAAHVQQTTIGGSSGWIGTPVVPEPSTWLAGALLLLPFGRLLLRVRHTLPSGQ